MPPDVRTEVIDAKNSPARVFGEPKILLSTPKFLFPGFIKQGAAIEVRRSRAMGRKTWPSK